MTFVDQPKIVYWGGGWVFAFRWSDKRINAELGEDVTDADLQQILVLGMEKAASRIRVVGSWGLEPQTSTVSR